MARRAPRTRLPPPFLKRVWLPPRDELPDHLDWDCYPFNFEMAQRGALDIHFRSPITVIVGENGSGKSTLLEAIAAMVGFGEGGGAQGMRAVGASEASGVDGGALGQLLRAAWLPQIRQGWFFRAETFFPVARYLDEAARDVGQLGPDFLSISHGEGFVAFFEERLSQQGLYIFDEPESALSPARQFDFLKILRRMQRQANSQVILATHSPILMALPDADLWHIEKWGIRPTTLEETPHFKIYREFIQYPHETVEAMIE
jgi:predicted ATPase